jgi:hypothetical protein
MRRLMLLLMLIAGVLTAVVGFAGAAKPTAGQWNSKHAHFTVNSKMTRVSDFRSKCTGVPLPLRMKVKANGTFSHKQRKALEGGRAQTEKVKGRFTSSTTAKVTASFGRCHEKFTATIKVEPVETEPVETQPPPTDEPY